MERSISMAEIIQLLTKHKQFLGLTGSLKASGLNLELFVFKQISFDSRNIEKDALFICKGTNFQTEYLNQAIKSGAKGYLIEDEKQNKFTDTKKTIGIIVGDSKKAMALVAMHFYDYPQKKLRVIGITGTKGKTTTSFFIKHILDQQNGNKTAIFSTMFTDVGMGKTATQLTTPESLDLYRLMDQAVGRGYKDLVMEVSSQAYLMNRVYQLKYDLGIFLNIWPDHIGENEHEDFNDYLLHKLKIFENCQTVVVNTNTLALSEIKKAVKKYNSKVIWTGTEEDMSANYALTAVELHNEYSEFQIIEKNVFESRQTKLGTRFTLNIVGTVNLENALVSIAATRYLGCSEEEIQKGLKLTKIPGRMEIIPHSYAFIIVDYAHNAISLQKLLQWTKMRYPEGRQIFVFGCPGDKGISRRQDLSEIVAQLADYVILTEDDPGFEDPLSICEEIATHLNGRVSYKSILNRVAAINYAIEMIKPGDVLLVVGKGSDGFQIRNGVREPYMTDSQAIKEHV